MGRTIDDVSASELSERFGTSTVRPGPRAPAGSHCAGVQDGRESILEERVGLQVMSKGRPAGDDPVLFERAAAGNTGGSA
jgi:hypothetical protein